MNSMGGYIPFNEGDFSNSIIDIRFAWHPNRGPILFLYLDTDTMPKLTAGFLSTRGLIDEINNHLLKNLKIPTSQCLFGREKAERIYRRKMHPFALNAPLRGMGTTDQLQFLKKAENVFQFKTDQLTSENISFYEKDFQDKFVGKTIHCGWNKWVGKGAFVGPDGNRLYSIV